MAKLHAQAKRFSEVMTLLKNSGSFFEALPKSKTAKVVRTIIDIVAKVPDSTVLQVRLLAQYLHITEGMCWCGVLRHASAEAM